MEDLKLKIDEIALEKNRNVRNLLSYNITCVWYYF